MEKPDKCLVCETDLPECECMVELYGPLMNPNVPVTWPAETATASDAVVLNNHCVSELLANGFSLSGKPKSTRDVE